MTDQNALRILLIEDSAEDAEDLMRELEASGLTTVCSRITNDEALAAALDGSWHAVLCDYVVPGMTWQRSLAMLREKHPDIPFIVVSGKRGEEFAVETMRGGCSDYIVKDRLMRLGPALLREINTAETTRQRREAQRLLEKELQRAKKLEATGRLAGGLARKLNNDLTVVMGSLDIVLMSNQQQEDRRYLSDATRATERAAKMVRQLARLGQKPDFEPTPVDLAALVAQVEDLILPVLPDGIEFVSHCHANFPRIEADPALLEQAMLNLVLNARDALPRGGSISLDAMYGRSEEELILRVADDGVGIDRDVQEQIFEPFYSTKGSRSSGLGLSSVFHAAQAHGGTVAIESVPGNGSKLEIVIPIRLSQVDSVESSDQTLKSGTGRVLVVDDAEDILLSTRGILTRCGYTVVTANGFEQAIEILDSSAEGPEVIIADVVMGEGRARDLLRWLWERGLAIPIIATSGYESERWEKYRLYEGFEAFLPKPFNGAALSQTVARVLSEPLVGKR